MYEFTTETKGYRGYIGSRRYSSGEYPQYVQNMLVRNYCQKHGVTFLLSATEYAMPGCYMMLDEVVNSIESLEGMVLFSIFMLPDSPQKRQRIYQRILSARKTLHAALEDISIKSEKDIQLVEDILNMNKITIDETILREFVEGELQNVAKACA